MRGSVLSTDERGVEDLIGFVLTFSVIITAVTFTATVGRDQIIEFQEGEKLNNAERAMELVGNDMDALESEKAVGRQTSLDLSGGELTIVPASDSNSPGIEITIQRSGGGASDRVLEFDTGSLSYRQDRGDIVYENGGLFRKDRVGDALPLSRPGLLCRDVDGSNHAVVASVVVLTLAPDASQSVSGDVTATLNMTVKSQSLTYPSRRGHFTNNDAVVVDIDSPRTEGWNRTLTREGSNWEGTGPYTCPSVTRVYVRLTVIELTLEQ